jgi:hypothetical protein
LLVKKHEGVDKILINYIFRMKSMMVSSVFNEQSQ